MDINFKDKLVKELIRTKVAKTWSETQTLTEEVSIQEDEISETDIGVASDGTRYIKSLVSKYLNDKGYAFSQENIDLVAKMFQANGNGYTQKKVEKVQKSDVDEITDDQFDLYLKAKIASVISEFRQDIQMQQFMNYDVEVISDRVGGATDVNGIKRSLYWHSEHGWRLKSVFTNEVGKNSMSFSTGGISSGTNSTMDQVVLIYERPAYMTDAIAQKLLREL